MCRKSRLLLLGLGWVGLGWVGLGWVVAGLATASRPGLAGGARCSASLTPSPQPHIRWGAIVQLADLNLPPARGRGRVELPLQSFEGGTAWTVRLRVGNQPAEFLLDTGASTSLIAPSLARRLRSPGQAIPPARLTMAMAGEDCPRPRARVHALPRISSPLGNRPRESRAWAIEGLHVLELSGAAVPGNLDGILGMDALVAFDLRLDPLARRGVLEPPSGLPGGDRGRSLRLQGQLGVLVGQGQANQRAALRWLLDTGAESTFLSAAAAARAGIDPLLRRPIEVTGFCGSEPAWLARLGWLGLGRVQRSGVEVVIFPERGRSPTAASGNVLTTLGVDGVLGQNVFNGFRQHWRFERDRRTGKPLRGWLTLQALNP